MDKKSVYRCIDGRTYDVTMSWDEKFKDADMIFPIKFQFVDRTTGKPLKLPKEFATYAFGDSEISMGERVTHFFGGNREAMLTDFLESAFRRSCDFVERGR